MKINKVKLLVYITSIITGLLYFVYRFFFTIPFGYNTTSVIFSYILLFVESIDFIIYVIYYLDFIKYKKIYKTVELSIDNCPDIDIFITTYNESTKLLDDTIGSCINMKYPNNKKIHIYLCDDGNRNDMKKLAKKYNINYISRNNNTNAKAGNLNNALKKSSSPYIINFDADMKPNEDYLLIVVPYILSSDHVGFVQVPQCFDNPDIFQLRLKLYDDIPSDSKSFYSNIQLHKNNSNTTIFCGTNAIISRKALDDIGGFQTYSITEDIATGMMIESKGYTCISLSDRLVYGLEANDIDNYYKQKSRWSSGAIQILKNKNILTIKGLSFKQKMLYIITYLYWLYPFKRIFYLITPMLYSLFGIMFIKCNLYVFLAFFIMNYVIRNIYIDMLENNKQSYIWDNIREIIISPIMIKSVFIEIISFKKTSFNVTDKNNKSLKSPLNRSLVFWHIIFMLYTITAIILSIYKIYFTNIETYILSILWLLINMYYLLIAIKFDLGCKNKEPNNFNYNQNDCYTKKSLLKVFKRNW